MKISQTWSRATAPVAADGIPSEAARYFFCRQLLRFARRVPLKAELLLAAGRHSIATTMLRTALRRARPASSAAPRRGIASGLNLLQLSTSDLQPARTWDAAEADGADAASGGASSPPSQLFWPTYDGVPPDGRAPAAAESTTRAARRLHRHVPPPALRGEEGRPLRAARRLHGRLREGPRAVLRETRKRF